MPREFAFRNRKMDFWIPIHLSPADQAARGSHYLNVVARLKPGATLAQAREDMNSIARQLADGISGQQPRISAPWWCRCAKRRWAIRGSSYWC